MEILNQFGFDIRLFAAQIVNFLVIAYLFKRFLYKPILNTLEKRNESIKKGLKDAQNATKAYEKAEIERDEILKKAGIESERMIEVSKQQALAAREEMLAQTKSDIAKMMQETKEQIVLERENFKNEARSLSLELSRQILESTITSLFDKKERDIIIKKGLDLIKDDKHTKN